MRRIAFAVLWLLPACAAGDESLVEIKAKIARYEKRLASAQGFDWTTHNELRHLYGAIDGRKSLHHSDIILEHSLMDDYILNVLSGWTIEKDPEIAIAALEHAADPDFKYVHAACLLKAGDLLARAGRRSEAKAYYERVARDPDERLGAYSSAAILRSARLRTPLRLLFDWLGAAGLASTVALLLFLVYALRARERLRRRLSNAARALGPRRCFDVCWRANDTHGGFFPWNGAGVLLAHRGRPVLFTESGERWFEEGSLLAWKGRHRGLCWFAVEGPSGSHYFAADPGVIPFGSESSTRRLLERLQEDLSATATGRGAGLSL